MSTPLRVLLVEDTESDALLVLAALRAGGYAPVFTRVQTAATMLAALAAEDWEIVLSDYMMPGFDALGALEVLQQSGRNIPFIIVSGTIGEDTAVAAMKLGAGDYLLKDRLTRLGPAVAQALEQHQLRRERKATARELGLFRALMDQSTDALEVIDPVTGRFLDVNETESTMLGYSRAELLAMGVPDIDPTVSVAGWEKIAAAIRQAGALSGEGRHRRKDGTEFPVEFNARWVHLNRDYIVTVVRDISERKQAEAALRRSERSLMMAQRVAHIGNWDLDLVNLDNLTVNPLRWSDELFRLFGYEPGGVAVNNELFFRHVHPDDREMIRAAVAETLRTGRTYSLDHRIILPDGTERVIHEQADLIRDEQGRPLRMVGTAQDVTERWQAAAALRQREEDFRLLFDSNPLPMWVYALDSLRFLAVNDAAVGHYGYAREEFLAMTIKEVRPAEDVPALLRSVERRAAGIDVSGIWRHRRKTGEIIFVHVTSHALNFQGRPAQLVLAQDVTAQHESERALKESEERFRQMIANGSDIIALVDQSGVIRFQSPSTERILGHRPEEMTGRRVEEYIHPEDLPKVGEAIQRVLASQEKPLPVEYRCRHRDGSWRTLQSLGKAMAGPLGEKLIVVNSRDVTEGRQLEEQLRQSQKMEAIGQLSGGVAHDFNNLLTVIKGYIGLLRAKGQVAPEIAGAIQQIDEAANRAANLTRQLLTFSRQQVMQAADFNLTGVVMNLSKMLRRLLTESIEMEVTGADQPLPIHADEGMVEQVLLNLVVNARDAMPKGGRLGVSTVAVDFAAGTVAPARPGAFACVVVSDTGTGIPPAVLPRIFEPFFTTKGVGQGTGLGLATVYAVMQQHGGWITVESTVGQGTTFRAYFPRQVGALSLAGARPAVAALRGGHEGILLVEDELAVREIAQAALAGLGYRVFVAPSGLAALQVWEAHRHEIELLLTDLVMPDGVTGRDLAVRLQDSEPKLPVIYMSGYSYDVAGDDFVLKEGENYLPKPFDLASLARIIRAGLDRSTGQSR